MQDSSAGGGARWRKTPHRGGGGGGGFRCRSWGGLQAPLCWCLFLLRYTLPFFGSGLFWGRGERARGGDGEGAAAARSSPELEVSSVSAGFRPVFACPPSAFASSFVSASFAVASTAPASAFFFFFLFGRTCLQPAWPRASSLCLHVLRALSATSCCTATFAAPWQVLLRLANLSALRCSVEVLPELLDRALPRLPMVAGEGILDCQGDEEIGGAGKVLLEPKMAPAAYMNVDTV